MADPAPSFGAIIIGDELLSGRREDKHLGKVLELLKARGLRLASVRYVGDERPRLVQTLRESFASGDIVFSFGGIGATPTTTPARPPPRPWPAAGPAPRGRGRDPRPLR
jgi:molybdopterin biosynthesis enzyme MoaB